MNNVRFAARIALSMLIVSVLVCGPLSAQVLHADKILVFKSKRQLSLMKDGHVLKTYRISLGRHPVGTKTRRGDGRTPEGNYVIDRKNAYSRFHLALHVSYPNSADLARARSLREDPGGNIMIHGLPNGHGHRWETRRFTDWTAGCIALSDSDINEIWKAVSPGTPIQIRP